MSPGRGSWTRDSEGSSGGPRMGSRELVSRGESDRGHDGLGMRLRGPLTTLEDVGYSFFDEVLE